MPTLPRDRLDYSSPFFRPPLKLPGKGKLIVWSVINIEEWESTAVRTNFRRTPEFASWQRELVSHLNPLHSHDYYERVITTG